FSTFPPIFTLFPYTTLFRSALVITSVLALIDKLYFEKRRKEGSKLPLLFEYAHSFFPVILIVFVLRSFLFEAYRIPSSSLVLTLDRKSTRLNSSHEWISYAV